MLIDTKDQLLDLRADTMGDVRISEEEILFWFDLLDAAWVHSGDPKDPHAELTSGNCSNAFFDCLRVLKYVNLSEILAKQLAFRLKSAMGLPDFLRVEWVLGSPMAAITFAHDVAKAIGAPINMFLEKDPNDPKKMLWKRMQIPAGELTLQIEELITTAHTLNAVEGAVRKGNSEPVSFAPYVGTIVHRPPKMTDRYGDREVVALIEREVWSVPQSECPLCKLGSRRVKPKTNWKELTGKV